MYIKYKYIKQTVQELFVIHYGTLNCLSKELEFNPEHVPIPFFWSKMDGLFVNHRWFHVPA